MSSYLSEQGTSMAPGRHHAGNSEVGKSCRRERHQRKGSPAMTANDKTERLRSSGIKWAFLVIALSICSLIAGTQPALAVSGICDGDERVGCFVEQDCIDKGTTGPCILPTGGGALIQAADNPIGCMEDVYNVFGQGGGLNCTANDINVTAVHDVVILDPCSFPGDTAVISFVAQFEVSGGVTRHDVGVYISADGGDALNGECSISNYPYSPQPPWLDLDGALNTCSLRDTITCTADNDCNPNGKKCDDPDDTGTTTCSNARSVTCSTVDDCNFGVCTGAAVQDTCGDITGGGQNANSPLFHQIDEITVVCNDLDNDGLLDTNACLSWRQPGANELCTGPLDSFPGSPAKCNCQELPGLVVPVPGQIIVDKVTVDFFGDPLDDPTLFDTRALVSTPTPAIWSPASAGPPVQQLARRTMTAPSPTR
jgi:hypothetical protein